MENRQANYEKINVYIASFSVIATVVGGIIYFAVFLTELKTKMEGLEKFSQLQERIDRLERKEIINRDGR